MTWILLACAVVYLGIGAAYLYRNPDKAFDGACELGMRCQLWLLPIVGFFTLLVLVTEYLVYSHRIWLTCLKLTTGN